MKKKMKMMKNMRHIVNYLIFIGVLFSAATGKAYSQYRITVKTNAFTDTVCYLGYYYGKFQYSKDTAVFNKKGIAIFEKKDKKLDRGIYIIAFPNKKHLDIIINNEQIITFEVDTADVVGSAKAIGSKENQAFFDYNRNVSVLGAKIGNLRKLEEKYQEQGNEDSLSAVQDKIRELSKKINNLRQQFIDDAPQSLVSKIFLMTKEPQLPESKHSENQTEDMQNIYNYYKSNYWKNMDMTDEALIRTPVFHSRLERYITDVLIQHPDTLIKEIDYFISEIENNNNKELFKYVVGYLTHHFETSQIMGHDAVFVHMADTYYTIEKAFWVSETTIQKVAERADNLRPILIGKIAPNMALLDTSLSSYIHLWSVVADYTIMIFWATDCGHCKKEIEKLKETHFEKEIKVQIYSVCTDTSLTNWKRHIEEKGISNWINVNGTQSALGHYQKLYDVFSTPLIYVLDAGKKIIAKRIATEMVEQIINQHFAPNRKEQGYENR